MLKPFVATLVVPAEIKKKIEPVKKEEKKEIKKPVKKKDEGPQKQMKLKKAPVNKPKPKKPNADLGSVLSN